jgi:hypothetical protein
MGGKEVGGLGTQHGEISYVYNLFTQG